MNSISISFKCSIFKIFSLSKRYLKWILYPSILIDIRIICYIFRCINLNEEIQSGTLLVEVRAPPSKCLNDAYLYSTLSSMQSMILLVGFVAHLFFFSFLFIIMHNMHACTNNNERTASSRVFERRSS